MAMRKFGGFKPTQLEANGYRVTWKYIGGGETTRHYQTYWCKTPEQAKRSWRRDYEFVGTYQLVSVVPLSEVRGPQPSEWYLSDYKDMGPAR